MRIFLPSKERKQGWANQKEMSGQIRDLTKINDDEWQLKFDVHRISDYSNFYIAFTDEEITYLVNEILRDRQSHFTEHEIVLEAGKMHK